MVVVRCDARHPLAVRNASNASFAREVEREKREWNYCKRISRVCLILSSLPHHLNFASCLRKKYIVCSLERLQSSEPSDQNENCHSGTCFSEQA